MSSRANEVGRLHRLGVVILAAGASSRMGRPKLLLPWCGTTVLGHLLAMWREVGAEQIAVVCAANDALTLGELDRLAVALDRRLIHSTPERGMFSSIRCAARWARCNPHLTHCAVALGDQPLVQAATLSRLLAFAAEHPARICQPSRHGHPRHPVMLPMEHVEELSQTKCATLREFLATWAADVSLVELDDPGLDLDLDTPADYERALRIASAPDYSECSVHDCMPPSS